MTCLTSSQSSVSTLCKSITETLIHDNAAESTTPPGSPPRSAASALRSAPHVSRSSDATSSPSKRRYQADAADAEVVKRIKLNEIELRDRNTVLRGVKPNVRVSSLCSHMYAHGTLRTSIASRMRSLRSLRS